MAKTVKLRFAEARVGTDISAVAILGRTLFCGCDEGAAVERLTRQDDDGYGAHRRFFLSDLFGWPPGHGEAGEIDIEGMAIDDGYLWLTGSHARRRRKPCATLLDADGLAEPDPVGRRAFLGRVPLRDLGDGIYEPVAQDDGREAACVKMADDGDTAIRRALGKHPLLAPFVELPAKENGLDVEGLAVRGTQVLLGLRGPVIGKRALVVECRITRDDDGWLEPQRHHGRHRLRLFAFDLDGLGVRDLRRDGDRLLILAGAPMAHDGPRALYEVDWPAGSPPRDPRPRRLLDLPATDGDNAEGIELVEHGAKQHLLVMHDTGGSRYDEGKRELEADLFRLKRA